MNIVDFCFPLFNYCLVTSVGGKFTFLCRGENNLNCHPLILKIMADFLFKIWEFLPSYLVFKKTIKLCTTTFSGRFLLHLSFSWLKLYDFIPPPPEIKNYYSPLPCVRPSASCLTLRNLMTEKLGNSSHYHVLYGKTRFQIIDFLNTRPVIPLLEVRKF